MNFLWGIISYGDQRESLLHAQSSVIAEETALDTSVQCERKDSEAGACQLIFSCSELWEGFGISRWAGLEFTIHFILFSLLF